MKKTFTFEVDFDEAVATDAGSNLLTSLGISKERGDELLMHCIKREDEISESGGDTLNSLIEAVKLSKMGILLATRFYSILLMDIRPCCMHVALEKRHL